MELPSKIAQIYGLERPEVEVVEPRVANVDTGVGIFDRLWENISALIPWALLAAIWAIWKIVAIILAILFLIGIIYSRIRYSQVSKRVDGEVEVKTHKAIAAIKRPENQEWARVTELINSPNENDWRLAIMEADIMLDDMMRSMGYTQDTLGEKLQSVEKSDFNTIEQAWDAHKVRNKIAHEGSNYVLTQREARKTIAQFQEVFDEFHYI